MNAAELRQRRKAAGLTQAELGKQLGLHRDFVGLMERGIQPVADRTALAMLAIAPADVRRPPTVPAEPVTTDPMERLIEDALLDAGVRYETDQGGKNPSRLDFRLPDFDVEIEVKRFHSERTGEQMSRVPNVIVAQGEPAVRFLAEAIRSGSFAALMAVGSTAEPA